LTMFVYRQFSKRVAFKNTDFEDQKF